MAFNKKKYPSNWKELRKLVQERAGDCCEGSPAYPDCRAKNGEPHPVTGSRVVCTVAHLFEHDHQTQDLRRLRFWCQRCHLRYDRWKHQRRAAETRARKKGLMPLLGIPEPRQRIGRR